MSKNLTRKGLAFGALVALGSSLIAGAPASAAGTVTLDPKLGTSYNTILGNKLVLKTVIDSASKQGAEAVKFLITDASKKLDLTNSGYSAAGATTDAATTDGASGADVNLTASDGTYVVTSAANAAVGPTAHHVVLTPAVAATDTFSVTVQAWTDFNGDNLITAGETVSPVRTVKFVKASEVTSTTVVTAPIEGDKTVTAKFQFNDINNEQLTPADFGIYFTDGTGAALPAGNNAAAGTVFVPGTDDLIAVSAWSATDGFKVTTTKEIDSNSTTALAQGLAKDTGVKAQPLYKKLNTAGTLETTDKIGTAATATVVARTAGSITAAVVGTTTGNATTSHVLLNSSFKLEAVVKDTTTPTAKVLAGKSTSVSVTSSATLSSTITLTVNGVTYTSNASLPGTGSNAKLAVVTDSNGAAVLNVTTKGFLAEENVAASFTVENLTASTVTAVSKAATYTGYVTNATSAGLTTTDGAAVAVNVSVYDQFGGVPADSFDARALFVSSTQGDPSTGNANRSTAASAVSTPIVGGKATLNIVDNGTGTGLNVYNVVFAKRLGGGVYSAVAGTEYGQINATFNVNIVAAADLVAGTITSTGSLNATTKVYENTAGVALNLFTPGNFDGRAILGTEPTVTGGVQNLAGAVSTVSSATAASTTIVGAKLTLSAKGLQFKDTVSGVYAADSITVTTGTAGAYSVNVYSNKSGTQTVTLTSGSKTQLVTIKFNAAGGRTGTVLTATVPTIAKSGATLVVSGLLVDKFGNAVDTDQTAANAAGATTLDAGDARFTVVYDGPGMTIPTTLPVETDATGKFAYRVILGNGETGFATLTTTYGGADGVIEDDATTAATNEAADNVVVTKTVLIGVSATVAAGKKLASATVKNALGLTVKVVSGTKVVTKVATSDSYKVSLTKLTAGKKTVKVYVNDILVASKKVTVRR